MKEHMRRCVKLLCVVALVVPTTMAIAQGTGKRHVIALVPNIVGIPYYNAAEVGAMQAGRDLDVEVIWTGPVEADAAQQVRIIEDLVTRGVDAIIVSPNDTASLTPVLRRAREAGIVIMDWDTPVDPDLVELSIHQIDDRKYGEGLFDLLVDAMGPEGEFAIITGVLSAQNLNDWIDYGLAYAAEKYPGLVLVTERIPTDEKQQLAYQRTLELIRTYPNLKGIIGYSSPAPIGIAQAVQERGLQDAIAVTGTAMPVDSRPFLEDGSMDSASLWDPGKLGYLSIYLAAKFLGGERPIDGDLVPNVGRIEVWADGKTVIMGPPTNFTKDNVAEYDF